MVRLGRIEHPASAMSTRRSPAELKTHELNPLCVRVQRVACHETPATLASTRRIVRLTLIAMSEPRMR